MKSRPTIYLVLALTAAAALTLAAVVLAPGSSSAGGRGAAPSALDPADFSTNVTNPLFPLSSLGTKVFEGEDTEPDTGEVIPTRLESVVLGKPRKVAGVQTLVLEEKAFANGELVERALDFFAQHRDGTVYYFGEAVDNYENGKLVDHAGSWLAGKNGAQPGIIMPAHPVVGQTFNQENAPGVAEDRSTVVALDERVRTPAGRFTGCAKLEDTSPLDPGLLDTKWYCPDVGLVRDEAADGFIELISYTVRNSGGRATAQQVDDVDDGDEVLDD